MPIFTATCTHRNQAFDSLDQWCEDCGHVLHTRRVSLVKPVNLVKRKTLRADDLVRHGIPANANGRHRRAISAR